MGALTCLIARCVSPRAMFVYRFCSPLFSHRDFRGVEFLVSERTRKREIRARRECSYPGYGEPYCVQEPAPPRGDGQSATDNQCMFIPSTL